MNFWRWKQSIPVDVCDVVIKEMSQVEKVQASVAKDKRIDTNVRNNSVYFLKKHHWFEGVMFNYIQRANKSAKWNFEIADCQSLQYTEYHAGQKYEWHQDQYEGVSIAPTYRKLTAVCQLSDSSEFTGGGLFIKEYNESLLMNKGDIVVFPSTTLHKADTVIDGVRKTVVCWAL